MKSLILSLLLMSCINTFAQTKTITLQSITQVNHTDAVVSSDVQVSTNDKDYQIKKEVKGIIDFKGKTLYMNEVFQSYDEFNVAIYNKYCNKTVEMTGVFKELKNLSEYSSYKSKINEDKITNKINYKINVKFDYSDVKGLYPRVRIKEHNYDLTVKCEDLVK